MMTFDLDNVVQSTKMESRVRGLPAARGVALCLVYGLYSIQEVSFIVESVASQLSIYAQKA